MHASERHVCGRTPRRLWRSHRIARPLGPVTVETVISAPREAVFDFVGDLANHVAFTDHFMSDYRLARAKSDGPGAAARFRLENPGPKQWAEVQFTVFERPRRIVEEGRSGRFLRNKFWTMWDFSPEGNATRVELTFWSEPATRWDAFKEALGARGWVKRQNRTALGRLRRSSRRSATSRSRGPPSPDSSRRSSPLRRPSEPGTAQGQGIDCRARWACAASCLHSPAPRWRRPFPAASSSRRRRRASRREGLDVAWAGSTTRSSSRAS